MKSLIRFSIVVSLVTVLGGCVTLDDADRRSLERRNIPKPIYEKMLKGEMLELGEIAALSKKNVQPCLLIRYIDKSLAEYHLKTEDVLSLRREDVDAEVVDYLLTTPHLNAPRYYDPYWGVPSPPIIIHHHHQRR